MNFRAKPLLVLPFIFTFTAACSQPIDPVDPTRPSPLPSNTSPPPSPTAQPSKTPLPTLTTAPEPTESGELLVPDLVGLTLTEAQELLSAPTYDLYINFRTGQEAPLGTVYRQDPPAGTILQEDKVVRIYVSAELITISASPGLEVGRNADLYIPFELEAGIPYHFYTQDTYNMTDSVEWGPVFNCCGRMFISPVGLDNLRMTGLTFTPEESGSYDVVIHNNNPVRFSFTFVFAYYSLGE